MNKTQLTKIRNIIMGGVLSTLLLATPAFAYTSSDFYETPKIKGYSYKFDSGVGIRNLGYGVEKVEADAYVECLQGNVPIGYMGLQARLYTQYGDLVSASSMIYNDDKLAGFVVYAPGLRGGGKYYAQSRAEFYNGDGYTKYTGYKSPIFTFEGDKTLPKKWKRRGK
jgi:hypothetical protein